MLTMEIHLRLPYTIEEEEGAFIASCEPLGVFTQGRSREEALANLKEAASVFVETCLEDGLGELDRVFREAGIDRSVSIAQNAGDTFELVEPYLIPHGGAGSENPASQG